MQRGKIIEIGQRLRCEVNLIFRYWQSEYCRIFRDAEVVLFFVLLPLAYPILYALIYAPEVVTNVPVVVVDDSRTLLSREIVQRFDASPAVDVVSYCANMGEAKDMMMRRKCYAVLVIPAGVATDVVNEKSSSLIFYTDMSLLLNYKALYMALTDVVLDMGVVLRQAAMPVGVSSSITPIVERPIPYTSEVMYNPTSGVASFLIPAVLVLILQQSFVLGIAMLASAYHEQKRSWFGRYHILHRLVGRTLCYVSVYIFNVVYLLHFVPWLFGYPQCGSVSQILLFSLPLVLSSIFMAITLSVCVQEREHTYLLFVFTSVPFIFLSGIAWPRYAMPIGWRYISYLIPATWGVEGFVQINTMGATLEQASYAYTRLWLLTIVYVVTAVLAIRYDNHRHHRIVV